jgi:hypothetical protein
MLPGVNGAIEMILKRLPRTKLAPLLLLAGRIWQQQH